MTWKNYFILVASIVFIIDIFFALITPGHLHPDEHFQIIEFMNYKLGGTPSDALPWEFHAQIRPWLQPACLWVTAKIFIAVTKITNPFTLDTIFRVESVVIAFGAQLLLALSLKKIIPDELKRKLCLPFVWLFFLIPILNARPSAENWSASMLIAAIAVFILSCNTAEAFTQTTNNLKIWKNKLTFSVSGLIVVGLLLGLAFQLRYTSAFFILGFAVWGLLKAKNPRSFVCALTLSFTAVILLGLLVDYWGYDHWIFTPWRYFAFNILQHAANTYGVQPWYYYGNFLVAGFPAPIAIFLLLFIAYSIIRFPGHLLTWCIVPYLLTLCIVAHKELRFLFPILTLLSLLGFLSLCDVLGNLTRLRFIIIAGFITYNLVMSFWYVYDARFLRLAYVPAWNKEMDAIRYWQTAIPANTLYGYPENILQRDPLCRTKKPNVRCLLRMYFYDLKHAEYIKLSQRSLQAMLQNSKQSPFYLYLDIHGNPGKILQELPSCRMLYDNSIDFFAHDYLDGDRAQAFLRCS
jgi:hypothetical protein